MEEEALFALNILFGVVSVFLNLIVVLLRGRILESYEEAGEVDQERIISQQSDQLKDLDREIEELSRELNSLETER